MVQLSSKSRLTVLLAVCTLLRLVVGCIGFESLREDRDDYGRLSVIWAASGTFGYPDDAGHVHPTAYRPPLYPWLLSWLSGRDGLFLPAVLLCHVILGMMTVGSVYRIAERHVGGWAWMPALAIAADPILLHHQQLVMTETLATALAVVVWDLSETLQLNAQQMRSKRGADIVRCLVLGVALGVSCLARPTALPWSVCVVGIVILQTEHQNRHQGRRLLYGGSVALGLCLLTLPWGVRNLQQINRFTITTTHGGYTLLLANNPLIYEHFREKGFSRAWDAEPFHSRWASRRDGDPTTAEFWTVRQPAPMQTPSIDELPDDRLAQSAALATINRETSTFVKSCLIRVAWLWALGPESSASDSGRESLRTGAARSMIAMWYGATYIAALIGLFFVVKRRSLYRWLVPLALLITLTGIHAVYWSNMRMRAPMMPVVYCLAAYGVTTIFGRKPQGAEPTEPA